MPSSVTRSVSATGTLLASCRADTRDRTWRQPLRSGRPPWRWRRRDPKPAKLSFSFFFPLPLDAMHELEDVFVLRVDLQLELVAFGVEPALELVEWHGRFFQVRHHDHREELAQRRLRDVDDVRVRRGQHGRYVRDDADGVDAD